MDSYREPPPPSPYVVTAFARFVVCLEAATGRELWRQQLGLGLASRGPQIEVTGPDELVVLVGDGLYVIQLSTGAIVQRIEVPDGLTEPLTLLVVGRRAYVSGAGVLSCIDLDRRARLWTNPLEGTGYGASSIAVLGHVQQGADRR